MRNAMLFDRSKNFLRVPSLADESNRHAACLSDSDVEGERCCVVCGPDANLDICLVVVTCVRPFELWRRGDSVGSKYALRPSRRPRRVEHLTADFGVFEICTAHLE